MYFNLKSLLLLVCLSCLGVVASLEEDSIDNRGLPSVLVTKFVQTIEDKYSFRRHCMRENFDLTIKVVLQKSKWNPQKVFPSSHFFKCSKQPHKKS